MLKLQISLLILVVSLVISPRNLLVSMLDRKSSFPRVYP